MRKKEQLTETVINCKNLKIIQKNIIKHSPHPHKVKITAVTKTFSYAAIVSAENKKIFNIGESKVQETEKKLQGNSNFKILGPVSAPIKKIQGNWRIHLIIKTNNCKISGLHQFLRQTIGFAIFERKCSGVRIQVDIDPVSML